MKYDKIIKTAAAQIQDINMDISKKDCTFYEEAILMIFNSGFSVVSSSLLHIANELAEINERAK